MADKTNELHAAGKIESSNMLDVAKQKEKGRENRNETKENC